MKSKKYLVLWGTLVIGIAFGLVLAGCASTGGAKDSAVAAKQLAAAEVPDEPKSIVITGFNLQGKTDSHLTLRDGSGERVARSSFANPGTTITFKLTADRQGQNPWTGTGECLIELEVNPGKTLGGARYWFSVDGTNRAQVDIKEAVTTLDFSNFVYETDYVLG
jgi:hypothetical protein